MNAELQNDSNNTIKADNLRNCESTVPTPHRSNTAYIFIPFTIDDVPLNNEDTFSDFLTSLQHRLQENQFLQKSDDSFRYLYRYVVESVMSSSMQCRWLHYKILPSLLNDTRYASADNTYRFSYPRRVPHSDAKVEFFLHIDSIHLYCFSTSVGILCFQLYLTNSINYTESLTNPIDPMVFSELQFSLKNVYQNDIYPSTANANSDAFSFLSLSKKILSEVLDESFTLFYYCPGASQSDKKNPLNEESTNINQSKFQPRANVLSYLEVRSKGSDAPIIDEYETELYYLRHCYGKTYSYYKDPESIRRETHCTSREICWGFTSEAAVCLACPEKQMLHSTFIENVFYKNFNNDYLLMYVLLLHQKYAIYMFLTKVNAGIEDTDALEKYQNDIHHFEKEFMYTHITEVPQYQELYEKIWNTFAIDNIFTDVREPLEKLNELRRLAEKKERLESEKQRRLYEQQQQEENDRMNSSLFILSVLGIISALVDGYDLLGSILRGDMGVGDIISMCCQYTFLAAILIICGVMIWRLRK